MQTGTVKWFNSQKGFGFIQPESGGPDVFVHISAVERAGFSDLAEGQKLAFEVVADGRSGKSSADRLTVAVECKTMVRKEESYGSNSRVDKLRCDSARHDRSGRDWRSCLFRGALGLDRLRKRY